MKIKQHGLLLTLGAVFWLIAVVAKWKFNGLIFGFDYSVFQPDGAFYAVKTLQILGHDQADAIRVVSNWYETKSPHLILEVTQNLKQDSHLWGVVSTRFIYPLLSAPFVYFFGLNGMLIIPAISYLIVIVFVLLISIKNQTQLLGIACIVLLTISPTFNRWMLVNYTDALLVALLTITSYFLVSSVHQTKLFYIILSLIFITSFVRFCLPIWLFLILAIREKLDLKQRILLILASIMSSLPAIFTTTNGLLPNSYQLSIPEKLLLLPLNLIQTFAVEIIQLLLLDRALLGLIIATLFIAVHNSKSAESRYFVYCMAGTMCLTAINGVQGVNFRYQLPIIPFIMLVLLSKELPSNWLFSAKGYFEKP
jgi:hypothetical protein